MEAVEQYCYTYTVTGRSTFKSVNERLMWKIKVKLSIVTFVVGGVSCFVIFVLFFIFLFYLFYFRYILRAFVLFPHI